jgi:hypothetical protein
MAAQGKGGLGHVSTALVLMAAIYAIFAWRTGRLSAFWQATTGALVLPGRAT